MRIWQASILRENWMLKALVFIAAITVGTSAGYFYSIGLKSHSPVVPSPKNVSTTVVRSDDEANHSIKQTVIKLREIKTGDMNPDIPVAAKPLLTLLKHQLRDLISDTINARSNPQKNPQRLRANIINKLKSDGITVEEPEEATDDEDYVGAEYVYGDIYNIVIERPSKHPDLLVATTTLGVCCGTDTSFYIFKNNGERWEIALAQEANDYDEISEAHGRFQYAISPPDSSNKFFVVTTNVNPWCTSFWQQIRYAVLRLGSGAYEYKTILSEEDTIYLGNERPQTIAVRADSFTLSFDGESSPDEGSRWRSLKYRVNKDNATLLQSKKTAIISGNSLH